MKTIVFGYHNMGCMGIDALLRNGFEISAVFTHPDNPDENVWFDSVAKRSARLGIPTFAPDDVNHPLWVETIKELQPDFLFSFYYRKLLKENILEIPRRGCFNLHGSLLPRYRGRAPVNWAILNGETETGVTLHHMTPKPDDGDIVCQQAVPIAEEDTSATLHEKLAAAAGDMLDEYLPLLAAGKAPRRAQDHASASYFGARRPSDGAIDWHSGAQEISNLVRAVTTPYPGAFTYRESAKITIWDAKPHPTVQHATVPGTVVSVDPLRVACGKGVLEVLFAQKSGQLFMNGAQLARDVNLVPGTRFKSAPRASQAESSRKRVLILGVNGFIGNALTERLLASGNYDIHGLDLNNNAIERFQNESRFYFHEGDISIHREWIEYHVKKCDVVLPLVAIATPIEYTRNPLRVFELDFEENLRIVRYCVKYGKRIVFPSTSEVYGMCDEREFHEDRSKLVLGPINKQRWIYSCSKQLLDRVIWAYGHSEHLQFTLFRPFNWIGPRLDSLESARVGSSRAITQLILNLTEGTPIQLIDGGSQMRCFTDISDGIECLTRIIDNRDGACDRQIFNIGNPDNEASIRELAEMLVRHFEDHELRKHFPPFAGMHGTESRAYYGEGYQDVTHRRPSIENAARLLNWRPRVGLDDAVANTLDYFLRDHLDENGTDAGSTSAAKLATHSR